MRHNVAEALNRARVRCVPPKRRVSSRVIIIGSEFRQDSPQAIDPGRSPERVLKAHSSDQVANLLIDPRSATERTGLPSPVSAEPHSVPAHDRLGPDDGYGVQNARKAAIKPNEQGAIGPTQIQWTRRAPSKHVQLMTENHNFGFKPGSRLEAVAQRADEKESNCDHQPQLCCDSSAAANPPDGVFGSDNRSFRGSAAQHVELVS